MVEDGAITIANLTFVTIAQTYLVDILPSLQLPFSSPILSNQTYVGILEHCSNVSLLHLLF